MPNSHRLYSIGGLTGVTLATTGKTVLGIWNPSGTNPVYGYELWYTNDQAVVAPPVLIRTSTEGTPDSVLSPTAENSWDIDRISPPSSVNFNIGPFSAEPTPIGSNYLHATNLPASTGSGYVWILGGDLVIEPGKGIAIITSDNVALKGHFYFAWGE